ncbi:hypothetical protein IT407_02495 [Candidatus Uhrbacteria bacterium]|nr:hypothetical protein [Candidatus Uhrbacteria bacterium]
MSFQRIFETARRMGSPLVVTDPAGREPMVVMTLEAFERMGDGLPSTTPKTTTSPKTTMPVQDEVRVEPMSQINEMVIEVMGEPEKAEVSEISMEERFFLEPEENG